MLLGIHTWDLTGQTDAFPFRDDSDSGTLDFDNETSPVSHGQRQIYSHGTDDLSVVLSGLAFVLPYPFTLKSHLGSVNNCAIILGSFHYAKTFLLSPEIRV